MTHWLCFAGCMAASSAAVTAMSARPATAAPAESSACKPGYSPCLPVVTDLNCGDIPDSKKPITVTGSDPYNLDRDGDGIACEIGSAGGGATTTAGPCAVKASSVFLTPKRAYYATRTPVARLAVPSSLSAQLCSAAHATYRDTGPGAPSSAVALYLYRSTASATAALAALCPGSRCSKSEAGKKVGAAIRFRQDGTSPLCVLLVAQKGPVTVRVRACGVTQDGKPYTVPKLKYDASFVAGAFISRGLALGA